MHLLPSVLLWAVAAAAVLCLRTWQVLPRGRAPRRRTGPCSLGVFLGSGGHTAEMVALLSTVDFVRYAPRTYVYCHGDALSLRLIAGLEPAGTPSRLLALPRARAVGQGLLSTVVSALGTLVAATYHTLLVPLVQHPRRPWVDVLLVNGPGTCVVLVMVTYVRRVLGLSYTRVIYVESFARVKSLSLSGKLLRPFVDTFVVQWPEAGGARADDATGSGRARGGGREVYRGWLV